jgi:hypothetical protein
MKKLSILLIILSAYNYSFSFPKTYNQPTSDFIMIRSNLSVLQNDGSTILLDGNMVQYQSDFSNNLDSLDIRKMSNFSENFGLTRNGTTLVVERRKTISNTDTIFFKLWKTHQITYQFELITLNMEQPGLSGYLEDLYLHTKTPINLNDTNRINFSINADTASASPFRFRVIFSTVAQPLILTFTSLKAFQQNNNININWKTENEHNLKQYNLERSTDGINFLKAFEIKANNAKVNNYSWIDNDPMAGESYYRIQISPIDGKNEYSEVLKVTMPKGFSFIKAYPNPVQGNNFNLQISNEPAGLYKLLLFNQFGSLMMQKNIKHNGGNSTQLIKASQIIPKGIYQLEIIKPDGSMEKIGLIY